MSNCRNCRNGCREKSLHQGAMNVHQTGSMKDLREKILLGLDLDEKPKVGVTKDKCHIATATFDNLKLKVELDMSSKSIRVFSTLKEEHLATFSFDRTGKRIARIEGRRDHIERVSRTLFSELVEIPQKLPKKKRNGVIQSTRFSSRWIRTEEREDHLWAPS